MLSSLLDQEKLESFLLEEGEKKYRIEQIYHAVYKDFVGGIKEISTLPESLRKKLQDHFVLSSLTPITMQQSQKDATSKALFKTQDHLFVESVLMRHLTGRITLCISSQVGCPMGCAFCATGKLGFFRNLTFYEIIDQILYFERLLKKEGKELRNIVFMGMGEPLLNYENVIRAIKTINDPKRLAKGARHITISTCGIVPAIEKLIEEKLQIKLAISLHAPNDMIRNQLMPVNKRYPLDQLMTVLDHYSSVTNKRIFYEYILLRGVNDQDIHAHELGKRLQGKLAHVNLIPYNHVEGVVYQKTEQAQMKNFQRILAHYGIPSTIRVSLGDDIAAACGQLANKQQI
jgi:23S rRNA (adenine2503-C2)-methyltransferase